jgi:sugar lactone lactonase YvrE|tara:strand:+ start:828 stop:1031 length:204 start_codon:yes stop_codon:yes gene_type:complete
MEQKQTFRPSPPDYRGSGIAIWRRQDKKGNLYLAVSVLGGKAVACFKNEPKPVQKDELAEPFSSVQI